MRGIRTIKIKAPYGKEPRRWVVADVAPGVCVVRLPRVWAFTRWASRRSRKPRRLPFDYTVTHSATGYAMAGPSSRARCIEIARRLAALVDLTAEVEEIGRQLAALAGDLPGDTSVRAKAVMFAVADTVPLDFRRRGARTKSGMAAPAPADWPGGRGLHDRILARLGIGGAPCA